MWDSRFSCLFVYVRGIISGCQKLRLKYGASQKEQSVMSVVAFQKILVYIRLSLHDNSCTNDKELLQSEGLKIKYLVEC